MKKRNLIATVAAALLLAVSALAQNFTTFDAPGAGTGSGLGTLPISINPKGAIAGLDRDANACRHGFIRDKHGNFTIFDDPNAGTGSGEGTRGYSINPAGAVTGWYTDAITGAGRGYVRAPDGTITNFDAPDAGQGPYPLGTYPWSVNILNPSGVITGWYVDANSAYHGFVRAADGTITEFDAPGSDGFTAAYGINPAGTITGYACSSSVCYGFVRNAKGVITNFVVPGDNVDGTGAEAISSAGVITGWWLDVNTAYHGFVRSKQGVITTFDPPDSGTGNGQGTIPFSINAAGAIAGYYIDANGVDHGFVRAADGTITEFDVPGAGTASGQGTQGSGNNNRGAITGDYIDGNGVYHGYLTNSFFDAENLNPPLAASDMIDEPEQIASAASKAAQGQQVVRDDRVRKGHQRRMPFAGLPGVTFLPQ